VKEIKNLEIFLGSRKIIVVYERNAGFFYKLKGLMFKTRKKARAIIFENCSGMGIHSFFVNFDFGLLSD
jgi:hypothetical protein